MNSSAFNHSVIIVIICIDFRTSVACSCLTVLLRLFLACFLFSFRLFVHFSTCFALHCSSFCKCLFIFILLPFVYWSCSWSAGLNRCQLFLGHWQGPCIHASGHLCWASILIMLSTVGPVSYCYHYPYDTHRKMYTHCTLYI